jgi:hypothetical protein
LVRLTQDGLISLIRVKPLSSASIKPLISLRLKHDWNLEDQALLQTINPFTVDRTELWLQIQDRQQPAKTNKLPNHHPEFDDLFIAEMFMEPIKESIVNVMVIQRQFIRVLQGNAFPIRKRISLFIQLRDFIFT